MLKRISALVGVAVVTVSVAAWIVTTPKPLALAKLPSHTADPNNGEQVFNASGCASCHMAPSATDEERLKLSGGRIFDTQFGTFRAPNISPNEDAGIGGWSVLDFVNAVVRGISPDGTHYYPAFPYGSYARMTLSDVIDLKAYMDTLPPVADEAQGHDLLFPFSIRRGIGLWKLLYLNSKPRVTIAEPSEEVLRGQYLVEGPGHCGECHTPRNAVGGFRRDAWLAGGRSPEGEGVIPNITPHTDGLADWSAEDIAFYLESGLSPGYDVVGGPMADVQKNMARLSAGDREAIAAYLKAVPARSNGT